MKRMHVKRKKYFRFYLFALITWIVVTIIFWMLSSHFATEISKGMAGILFVFGVCGIPIIVFFSILVQVAEYLIDRIPSKSNQ